MAQRKIRRESYFNKPETSSARPGGGSSASALKVDSAPVPFHIWLLFIIHTIGVLNIVLWLTAMTYNLDDIKRPIFLTVGPCLMLLSLLAILRGVAPAPPRWATIGLISYGVVMLVSTLFMEPNFRWTAYKQLQFVWAAAGFMLSATCIAAYRRPSELFFRFLVLLLLTANIVGFLFFDPFNNPNHYSAVAWFTRTFFGQGDVNSRLYQLLYTLMMNDNTMQSTILNRDFYAGFCILLFPFALVMALSPGESRNPIVWRVIGAIAMILAALSIFCARSKGEWIAWPISVVFFAVMYAIYADTSHLRRHHLVSWAVALLILFGSWLWMNSANLAGSLKALDVSVDSRSIMWTGAWRIFTVGDGSPGSSVRFPILGGGPGTYGIYFPQHRRPDYFDHEISHVTTYSHNYILDLLSETGVLGFAAYAVMLGALVFMALYCIHRRKDERRGTLLLACLAGLGAYFISNMSSPSGRWIIGAVPLWTVYGFTAGLLRQHQGWKLDPTAGRDWSGIWDQYATPRSRALSAALTLLVLYGIGHFFASVHDGFQGFRSALHYAKGIRLMDPVYENRGQIPRDRALDMLEEAATELKEATRYDPVNVSAYYKAGSIYSTLSQIYRSDVEQYRNGDPAMYEQSLRTVLNLLQLGKKQYGMITKLWPDYAEIHYNLGIVNKEWALWLEELLNKNAALARAITGMDEAALRKEIQTSMQDALMHLERMGKFSTKREVAQLQGAQYLDMNLDVKARDVFRTASDRYKEDSELAKRLYISAQGLGDKPDMILALDRLWHIHPADNALLGELIKLHLDQKNYTEVEKLLTEMEKANPVNPLLFSTRIELLQLQGNRQKEILDEIEKFDKVGGAQAKPYLIAGRAAEDLKQTPRAIELYKMTLGLDPNATSTHTQQAQKRLAELGVKTGPTTGAANTSATATTTH